MRSRIVFRSRPLPSGTAQRLRERLRSAHDDEPFSPLQPRRTVRRVAAIAQTEGMAATVYRGGLDLRGAEVDHVWLALSRAEGEPHEDPYVVDVAFPLFAEPFVDVLRRFVAGDAEPGELVAAAAVAGLDDRVLGVFPPPLRYLGAPVWTARS